MPGGALRQRYPDFEVLVLDDQSTDETFAIASRWASRDPRFRALRGSPTPAGWTGKNWACWQLAQAATGRILLFTDADTWHHPEALWRTVGWMERLRVDLLSAFPQQRVLTWAERLWVPLVHDVWLYSVLPLWTSYRFRHPALAAANGQWMAWRREAYERIGGHEAVRAEVLEDVVLARRLKRAGGRMIVVSGRGMVFGRMYRSAREVWEGFSKNLFGLLGYRSWAVGLLGLGVLFWIVAPYALWAAGSPEAAALAGLNVLWRALAALFYRHPPDSVLLHPIGALGVAVLALHSWRQHRRGRVQWKGRLVPSGYGPS